MIKIDNKKVLVIILGGGQGTRLYPLTKDRAKPAVPVGSKHRIVDVPISLSINSGFNKIYVLTQFNSASLNGHLTSTYAFDNFSDGFVEILAAEQNYMTKSWYEGTADAVRKNIHHFKAKNPDYIIILSGDQLYRMDLGAFLNYHVQNKSDITISSTPVNREDATGFGIINADGDGKIKSFIEKPAMSVDIENIKIADNLHPSQEMKGQGKLWMGSMGIYCFNAKVLYDALDNDYEDFGKVVIPKSLEKYNLFSYIFTGFWEDIGTIKSYYETSLALAKKQSPFSFYDQDFTIYSSKKYNLPPSKIFDAVIYESMVPEGAILEKCVIKNSVIGIRAHVGDGSELDGVVLMGCDYYEEDAKIKSNIQANIPNLGVGKNCKIRKAIIDKDARIGDNVSIGYKENFDYSKEYKDPKEKYFIKDGIVVIPKNGIIPDNTII